MSQQRRPIGLIILAIYQIWIGVVTNFLGGCGILLGVNNSGAPWALLIAFLVTLLGLVALICGIALFTNRRWAWRGSLFFHLLASLLFMSFLVLLSIQVTQISNFGTPGSGIEFFIFLALLLFLVIGVSIWSFIYLRRPRIREQFHR